MSRLAEFTQPATPPPVATRKIRYNIDVKRTYPYSDEVQTLINKRITLEQQIKSEQSRIVKRFQVTILLTAVSLFAITLLLNKFEIYLNNVSYHVGIVLLCLFLLAFALYSILAVKTDYKYDQAEALSSIRTNLGEVSVIQKITDHQLHSTFSHLTDYATKSKGGRFLFDDKKYSEYLKSTYGVDVEPDIITLLLEAQKNYLLEKKLSQLQKK